MIDTTRAATQPPGAHHSPAGPTFEVAAGEEGEISVAATVDPDSLPADEGNHAGRAAIDRLKGRSPQFD